MSDTVWVDGNALKQAQVKRGLSQGELERLVGLSRTTLRRLQNGTHRTQVRTVHLLANALGVSVPHLLGAPDPDEDLPAALLHQLRQDNQVLRQENKALRQENRVLRMENRAIAAQLRPLNAADAEGR